MSPSAILDEIRTALAGRAPATITLGYGSILLVDFSPPEGDGLSLRVECAWRLETDAAVLAASEDSRDSIRDALVKLPRVHEGRVEVVMPGFELRLSFDGYTLRVFPIYAENSQYENWTIHTADKRAIIAGPGRRMQIVRSDETPQS